MRSEKKIQTIEDIKKLIRSKDALNSIDWENTKELKNLIKSLFFHFDNHQETIKIYQEELNRSNDGMIALTLELEDELEVRKQVEAELGKYRNQLESLIEKRTEKLLDTNLRLNKEIKVRKEAENELKKLSEKLEQKVKQRTKELEIINKELESFSYSVSHDLRAPLRHIQGFSELLRKKIRNDDNKVLRYLDLINESTKNMGNLIERLLEFSRFGRKKMLIKLIDMNQLVDEVITSFQLEKDDRPKIIKSKKLLNTEADRQLIYQVWYNYLSNAIKYSSKKLNPEIEIGCYYENDQVVYFIKDNGVGFDPKYIDKLFGVFQRLHSDAEFDGTGIGLANVKRIVTKHGGEVWAESEIDKGAKFYFSLPIKKDDSNESK